MVTLLEAPYTMLRDGYETLAGNEKYEGYLVDLIDVIAKKLGKSINDDLHEDHII